MATQDDIENRLKTIEKKVQHFIGMMLLIDDIEKRLKRLEHKIEALEKSRGEKI